MKRKATCCCQTSFIEVDGDPVLNGICHCDNCRQKTGSAFGWSAYFADSQIVARGGAFAEYRIREEQTRSFCAKCGTTLFWKSVLKPDQIGIAGGAFLDPALPQPNAMATSSKCVEWVGLPEDWRILS
jgi:hypothetical protein